MKQSELYASRKAVETMEQILEIEQAVNYEENKTYIELVEKYQELFYRLSLASQGRINKLCFRRVSNEGLQIYQQKDRQTSLLSDPQ